MGEGQGGEEGKQIEYGCGERSGREKSLLLDRDSHDSPTMNSTLKLGCWAVFCLALCSRLIAQPATNVSSPNLQPPATPLKPPEAPLSAQSLAQINQMTSLFDGKTLDGWIQVPENSWTVKDGAMASLGLGRGVVYTAGEFNNFRLIFSLRHLGGPPQDHQAGVLIFCTAPEKGQKGLDALGAIQFQPPKG